MRVAFSNIALNTGSSSPAELEMALRTSAVAACCPSAASRSRVRWSSLLLQVDNGRVCGRRFTNVGPIYATAAPLHRLSATPASLHVAPYSGFTTMLNPRQILLSAPWRDLKGQIGVSRVNVRFGSKADICGATSHVRFTPNCDWKSGHLRFVMSASPPKADMCGATRDVRFGPKADSCRAAKKDCYSITSSARVSIACGTARPSNWVQIDRQIVFCWRLHRQVGRKRPGSASGGLDRTQFFA
jgi:hypothetical protein